MWFKAKVSSQAVFGHLARAKHGAGVIDQHIDSGFGTGNLGRHPLHLPELREIGVVNGMGDAGSALVEALPSSCAAIPVPRDLHDARAQGSEVLGCYLPDA
jgi:hypothetical protein